MSAYDILVLQDGTEAKAGGSTDEEVALIRGFSRRFYTLVLRAKDNAEVEREANALYATLTDAEKKAIDWPNLHGSLSLGWALAPGSRENLKFDICPVLRQVRCPVLALNGGKDCQVPPRENLAGIERELKAGGNKDYTLRELPGVNHLLADLRHGSHLGVPQDRGNHVSPGPADRFRLDSGENQDRKRRTKMTRHTGNPGS